MLTKQGSEAYDCLPESTKQILLALSILIGRINDLPKADRDRLFELLQGWRDATHPDDQKGYRLAMEEILAQTPARSSRIVTRGETPRGDEMPDDVKKWATFAGGRIKELREKAGLTQAQLAAKAGLQQSHVSRLENAEYSPTHKTLEKIASAHGVEVGSIDPSAD